MKTKLKKSIVTLLIATLVLTTFVGTAFAVQKWFADAQGHWAEDVINTLAQDGVIAGYPEGLVHPDNIITRSEFSVLVARTMKFKHTQNDVLDIEFTDITNHWAEKDIKALIAEDVIIPTDYSTEFYPNEPITRYEMIRMLVRALGDDLHDENCKCETGFTDIANLTKVQLKYVCTAKEYGIANGFPDGTLRPFFNATRAEAFTMLVNKNKAMDKIEQAQADKDKQDKEEKPPKPSGGGSSGGGGSSYNPAPVFSFDLPQASYVGDTITCSPNSQYVSSVKWTLEKDGVAVSFEKFFDGSLSANGGTIKAKESGDYTLIATASNSVGKTTTIKDAITIYPVVEVTLKIPETSYTDREVEIGLNSKNLGNSAVKWTITKDGIVIDVDKVLEGNLDSTGGIVFFNAKGKYTVAATVVDGMGKFITVSSDIIIHSKVSIDVSLPQKTYTDKGITLDVYTKNAENLKVDWSLIRNGVDVKVNEHIEGILQDKKNIRFKEKGVYKLTATIVDETGRKYTDSADITVYPVGSAGFYLPEIFHTDNLVMVDTTFTEIGSNKAKWTLKKDGKEISMEQSVNGTLNDNGGSIKFKNAGSYTLFVSFTDDGGRSYSYEQDFIVYPIPVVTYTLPKFAHTDTQISVTTTLENIDGLKIEWLIDNTNGYQDWKTYVDVELSNNGGDIIIKRAGVYELVARITDKTGRVFLFESKDKIEVFPALMFAFDLPNLAYTDTVVDIRTHGNYQVLPVEWTITKDGKSVPFDTVTTGKLNENGGKLRFTEHGEYVLTGTMTDYLDRRFSHSETIQVMPIVEYSFTMPDTIHYGTEFTVAVEDAVHTDLYTVAWAMTEVNKAIAFDGNLDNNGGNISISHLGTFILTSTITDSEGRLFTHSRTITVINTAPNKPIVTVKPTRTVKDGLFFVEIEATAIDPDGDEITLEWAGRTANDYYPVGTHTVKVRAKDITGAYSERETITFEIINHAPTVTATADPTRTVQDGNFLVNIKANATDVDGDATTLEWDGRTENGYYSVGTHTVKVRAKDIAGAYSEWENVTFEVINHAPTVTATADPTRTVHDGKFRVDFSATATDADGDATTLEWDGRTTNDYYSVGTHQVRVRAKDIAGAYSEWQMISFTITNQAPSTPVITRTPSGNSVAPGTAVTINATSADPDGDTVTYIWENRDTETQTYPLGRNLVRVKAVDEAGAESRWAAIVFFVADSSSGGGMTLTGPDSTIMENGLDGATISEFTFTVPPVSGHSGNDYGRVRGYNIHTNQWEQLAYGTTNNGITFNETLEPGTYSRLEFYYYTNHDCMYNKSNITYSVEYFFQ